MNVFIIFIKFLGWIVAIWMRLIRLIEEKGNLRFWKEATTKIKHRITKKKILDPGGPGPLPNPSLIIW